MIKGDIDLTENLDFKRDKPNQKKLPSVPWKKNECTTGISVKHNVYDIDYTIDNYHITTTSYDYENIYSNITSFTITYTNSNDTSEIYLTPNGTGYNNYYYNTSDITFSSIDNIYWTTDNIHSVIYDDMYPISNTYLSKPKSKIPGRTKKLYNSIFKYCRYCGKKHIGNKCKEKSLELEYSGRNYFDIRDKRRRSLSNDDKDDRYVLYPKGNKTASNTILDSVYDRAKKIPWLYKLYKKHSYMYKDYISELTEDGKDYMVYLNNSWFRPNR